MSQDETASAPATDETTEDGGQKREEESEGREHRQPAWQARQDLIKHAPSFASSLVHGDQFGQTGGTHIGDTILHFGGRASLSRGQSGPIPAEEIESRLAVFRDCPSFEEALSRLRSDRVVVLTGGDGTGRRSAALMLLARLGVGQMRDLEPHFSPTDLPDQVDQSVGYVLCDWVTHRRHPVRALHLQALREQLERAGGHMVITVEPSAALLDVPSVGWEPPPTETILHAHVTDAVGEAPWEELGGLAAVKEFLAREHLPGETAQLARRLVALHRGETTEEAIASYDKAAAQAQIERWLTEPTPELLDKAFLISLAVFDGAPYAVTAELGDRLFVLLQKIADPREPPRIPVFGSSRADRLELARADGHMEPEVTDRGVHGHFVAQFQNPSIARLLLHEVWNLHPSARPALVEWIRHLAKDGRPLVRTRAAGAAALLAEADFPSTLAHLVEPWADSASPAAWLAAANTLTMAVLLKVRPVPGVLRAWCTQEEGSRRWTAIRAYGLLGPAHHEPALNALLDAARRPTEDEDDAEEAVQQLADALEILLLAVQGPVLAALGERIADDRVVRDHALLAFVQACKQPEEDGDRPLVLAWYSRAAADDTSEDDRLLSAFWRVAIGDQSRTQDALAALRTWVLAAANDPESEAALALLLPSLVTTPANHQRVSHLLRTVHDSEGHRPSAADRLQATLPTPDPSPRGDRP